MGVPWSHITPEEAEQNRKWYNAHRNIKSYPYTHPIREIPNYSRIKGKNNERSC